MRTPHLMNARQLASVAVAALLLLATTTTATEATMTPVLVLVGTTDLASCNASTAVNQQIINAQPDACTSTGTSSSVSSVWVNCTGRYMSTFQGSGNCGGGGGGGAGTSSGSSGSNAGSSGTKTSFACSNGMFYQCALVPSSSLVSGTVYGDANCSMPLTRTLTQVGACTLTGPHQSVRLTTASPTSTSVSQSLFNTTSCTGATIGTNTFQSGKCAASGLAGTHVVVTTGFTWPPAPSASAPRPTPTRAVTGATLVGVLLLASSSLLASS